MDLGAALRLARDLMTEHGLLGWSVVLDRAKTRAGVCRFRQRSIGLSGPITRLHTEEEVRDTILHEIAHALVGPDHGHDDVWRARARAIGCSGERCVPDGSPRPSGLWVGTCPAGHEVTRHRRPTRVLSCPRCRRTFSPEHLFAWTYAGRPAAVHPEFAKELAALRARHGSRVRMGREPLPLPEDDLLHRPLHLGDLARITAPGRWQGATGVVEGLGVTRVQLRVDDVVVPVPRGLLEPA